MNSQASELRSPAARDLAFAILLNRVRGEFNEMPGMRLSLEQAMRLWAMDRHTCVSVLGCLTGARFLEHDGNGRYRRAHGGY